MPAACQHELSDRPHPLPAGHGCQLCLVPEGVKNLSSCSLEVLGVPCDNREAVHLGGGGDQPVYDGKRRSVMGRILSANPSSTSLSQRSRLAACSLSPRPRIREMLCSISANVSTDTCSRSAGVAAIQFVTPTAG